MSEIQDFINTQEQIIGGIEQTFLNFKKDGADRTFPYRLMISSYQKSITYYRLIPIPHIADSKMFSIVPVAEYAAISLKKDAVISLRERDMTSCLPQNPQVILCHLNKPIYHIKDDQSFCETMPKSRTCKTITETCKNGWTELSKLNSYFYFCCDQCQLKLLCEDQITAIQLTRTGVLTVGQGCVIKSADFLVYTHKLQSSQINVNSQFEVPEISPINHIINISVPNLNELNTPEKEYVSNLKPIQYIKEKIEIMKQDEPISDKVSYHDIHHYTAIYILFAVVGIFAVMFAGRRLRRSWRRAPAEEAAAAPQPAACSSSSSVSVRCSECVKANDKSERAQCSIQNQCLKTSAGISKHNRGTSPVLRSVFMHSDDV